MDAKAFLDFLSLLEKLKCNTRHSWTSDGRRETVAAHSWRLAVMAFLLRDALPGVDMERVLQMCLVHDFGEAVTGDIPAFLKTDSDDAIESRAVDAMLSPLPVPIRQTLLALFAEMDAQITPESRAYKALDKLEAVLQHNEADLSTWLELEYALQQTYGIPEAEPFPALKALRAQALCDTRRKIEDVTASNTP